MTDANKLAESLRAMRRNAKNAYVSARPGACHSITMDSTRLGDLTDAADMLEAQHQRIGELLDLVIGEQASHIASNDAWIARMRTEIGRLEHPAAQADQINVRRVADALSWMGYSTPEGGTEAAASHLGRLVNDLATAVLKHKQETQDRRAAERANGKAVS